MYTLRGEKSRFDPLNRTFFCIIVYVFCQVYKIQKPLGLAVLVDLFFLKKRGFPSIPRKILDRGGIF